MVLGKPGTGKSRLLADVMALGARLIADDQVALNVQSGMLMAGAPKELSTIMELRGMGLVRITDAIPRHVLHLVVELSAAEPERLPEQRTTVIEGHTLPLLALQSPPGTSAAALLIYIRAMQEGRILPTDWCPQA